MEKKEVKKPFYEKAILELRNKVGEILKDTPEICSVSITVDWSVGSNDLPPGQVIINECSTSTRPAHETLLAQSRQLAKMQSVVMNGLSNIIAQYDETIKKAQEQKKEEPKNE